MATPIAPIEFSPEQAEAVLRQMAALASPGGAASRDAAVAPITMGPMQERALSPLKQAELRYRALVERIPAVTFMAALDGDRHEFYVSPQVEALLGFSQKEWLDNPFLWYRHVHPDDRDRWAREFASTCSTGVHFRSEYRLIARSGQVVWVHGECQLIRDEQGHPIFLQGIAFDITERKLAVEVLERAHLELEALVQERTGELSKALAALRGEMTERNRAEEDLRKAKDAAEHLSLHDKLTGLPNRALLHDRLNHAIERTRRDPNYNFALLFLDFDRFKIVNDSLGHGVGDELLVGIAGRLRQSLRRTDSACLTGESTAARLGGDEFVVLAEDLTDVRDVAIVANRLMKVLSEPYNAKGHVITTTVSIGITTSAGQYESAEDVVRDADTAMYHAKAAGKARYVLFDRRMHEEILGKLELENDLRHAVQRGQLLLHYQPIVSLASRSLRGFEALLRWDHPRHGRVSPAQFIPVCEETGLIIPIGYWVLAEACRQLTHWRRTEPRHTDLHMTVNLSARQLLAPDLVENVKRVLDENGADPASIVLEITESAMIENAEKSIPVLQQLRALGVRLYMDDFGTGYSSLSCLHRFPLSGLKIDRSFVAIMTERRDYAAIVHAIITLARNLDIHLVAEGIETLDQAVMLQTMECESAQGYLFSKPMAAAAAEEWLEQCAPSERSATQGEGEGQAYWSGSRQKTRISRSGPSSEVMREKEAG